MDHEPTQDQERAAPGPPADTNSRAWWEDYFRDKWEANRGREQTRHFMTRLIESLPAAEISYLSSRPLDVLDWGCALGEGVEALADRFTLARVSGLDFSATAVESARRHYPGHEFLLTDGGAIPRDFDVIVTSNCLEHFERPMEVVEEHLKSCRSLYFVLVPYNEFPLCESHRAQFRDESFPRTVGGFVRLTAKVIDVDQAYWTGRQLLVVYGAESYVRDRAGGDTRAQEREKWERYYAEASAPQEEDEDLRQFGRELVERVSRLLPPGAKILEAGCGAGWQSLALARSGRFRVTLMDFSEAALAHARRLFARENVPAEFLAADAFNPGPPEYDLVFNAGVLEHYTADEQAALLRGMASRSRKYVMALVPNRLCAWYWLWRLQKAAQGEWPFGREVPLADLSQLFTAAGLGFAGQAFVGTKWTEGFLRGLWGMDEALLGAALDLHRSPLAPDAQRAYLVAGLGTVSAQPGVPPPGWAASPFAEDRAAAEMSAALADALALRVGAEVQAARLHARLDDAARDAAEARRALAREQELRAQLEVRTVAAEQAARDAAARAADLRAELVAAEQRREALRSALAGEQHARQLLESTVAATYEHASAGIRGVVRDAVPRGATVLVVSKGDESLVDLPGATGWHFPRGPGGEYAGHYPADSAAAVDHLESLRAQGAQFILFPSAAFWWLEHYRGLRDHLETHYARTWSDDRCVMYRLVGPDGANGGHAAGARWRERLLRGAGRLLPAARRHDRVAAAPKPAPAPAAARDPAPPGVGYDVVCFSVIEWDFRVARPQQVALRFADAGHRVFYLSQQFRPHGEPYVLRERRPNVFEVSLRGPRQNIYRQILAGQPADVLAESLAVLRRDLCIDTAVSMVHLPFWWPLARAARESAGWPVVYDLMDHHAGFSTIRPHTLQEEDELLASADLVIATAEGLERDARRRGARNVTLVRNGCDYEHFAKAARPAGGGGGLAAGNVPDSTPGNARRPVVGYFGAVADWFDADLVAELAARRADWDFVLVGSTHTGDTRRLDALPNVSLPGEKPYAEIPDWLAKFDVTILPFKRVPLTEATNPVKAYEILAAGKPLVSVPLPEMALMAPHVRLAADAAAFEREIQAALAERGDPGPAARRRAFARENTWHKRFELIDAAVRATLPKDDSGAEANRQRLTVRERLAEKLREISTAGELPLVYTTPVDWNIPLFQRPQQMALALGALGQPTLYVTPNSFDRLTGVATIAEHCHLFPLQELGVAFETLDRFVLLLLSTNPGNPSVAKLASLRDRAIVVYDYIDELHPDIHPVSRQMRESHEYLLRNADLVCATADALHEEATRISTGRVIMCANGADLAHFRLKHKPPPPNDLEPILRRGGAVIGYFGALAKWFDYDLIREVARSRPDYQVVLIGADYDNSLPTLRREELHNVHYLGPKPYALLPRYAAYFDVATVPFRLNDITHATSPIKLFEYMASRTPVVTTDLRECRKYDSVLIGRTTDEFVRKLDDAVRLKSDEKYMSRLDKEADDNSWQGRARDLIAAVRDLAAARGWTWAGASVG